MRKRLITVLTAAALTGAMSVTAFAAGWQQNAAGWWYGTNADNSQWYNNGWQWIDGNNDGVSECYYFDSNGYILANTTTPDGYQVNSNGAWVENGVVKTQSSTSTGGTATNGVHHNAGYDPTQPLKNVVDQWGLRLNANGLTDEGYIKSDYVVDNNVQARLTGQLDKTSYAWDHAPLVDGMYSWAENGNTYQIDKTSAVQWKTEEDTLYQWFCDWLNSWDFENASEMEKAQKIKEVLQPCTYEAGIESSNRNDYITVLINRKGKCAEFAMTATALAEALGLKHAITGSGEHAVYYIWVDGQCYMGSNAYLNLDYPSSLDRQGDWTDPALAVYGSNLNR